MLKMGGVCPSLSTRGWAPVVVVETGVLADEELDEGVLDEAAVELEEVEVELVAGLVDINFKFRNF